jgi:hypothetical protein
MSWWERQLKTYFKAGVAVSESTLADGNILSYNSSTASWENQGVWVSYTPTYTCSGSMTYTAVTTTYAKYMQIGNVIFVRLYADGTTGGTASTEVRASLPIAAIGNHNGIITGVRDAGAGALTQGFLQITAANGLAFFNATVANWSLGAGRFISCNTFYEVA